MRATAVLVLVVAVSTAHADPVDDLVAKGEALARAGDLTVAIEAFKQADAQRPRAKHACLIGLAYTRRELWPQAELFFELCRGRANASDPVPDWLVEAEAQLATKLTALNTVAVSFTVTPPNIARIWVSSFTPDERFGVRTIHLAPGTYTIEVTADDYVTAKREITIATDGPRVQTVPIDLVRAHPPPPPSHVPTALYVGGLGLGLAGALVDLFMVRPARGKLSSPVIVGDYTRDLGAYELRRDLAVGLYAVGGLSMLAGFVLRQTILPSAIVAPTVTTERILVGITWVY